MFITRMALNPARRGARFLTSSPQAMHAAVLAAFPPSMSGTNDGGRVLWRLDQRGVELSLYLVSPERPDLTHVIEQAGWPTASTWETRDYDPLLGRLQRGQRYAFRVVANPVRHAAEPELDGKWMGHVTVAQQKQWLIDKSERLGFTIVRNDEGEPSVEVSDRRKRNFRRQDRTVTISTARFDGVLEVTGVEDFRRTLSCGLGRAKAYGCGLLTLARI